MRQAEARPAVRGFLSDKNSVISLCYTSPFLLGVAEGSRILPRRVSSSQSLAMLRIYNSLAREKQEFIPLIPGEVRMYVCGMTVYDYCHLGHARMMVVFDMVARWLRTSGFKVTYVRNITDIDDKIIRRARESDEPIGKLTSRFI